MDIQLQSPQKVVDDPIVNLGNQVVHTGGFIQTVTLEAFVQECQE